MLSELRLQRAAVRHALAERHEAVQALPFDRVGSTHHGGLGDRLVLHQRRLHLGGAQQVTWRETRRRLNNSRSSVSSSIN